LDGAFTGQPRNWGWVTKIAAAVRMPVELGGGIRTLEQIREALSLGVERVVLGTQATSETFLDAALREFGAERIVVGIDARDGKVAVAGWTQGTQLNAVEFARRVFQLGTYRLIYTDISTDGMLSGPPVSSIRKLCEAVGCFVIASGGVGSVDDVEKLSQLDLPNLEGVIVGKALYEKKFTLRDISA
jgi:phosphoribosylformimino-5-aminoimidazole carboxamide ribotide isomerase